MTMQNEMRYLVAEIEGEGLAVTAPMVVERAMNAEKWPLLNAHFWQPSEADLAHEARVSRAHRLLIIMRVTVAETGGTTRFMVHARGSSGYVSMTTANQKPDLLLIKLRQLQEDIARARARFLAFRSAMPDDLAEDIDAALAAAERTLSPRTAETNDTAGVEAAA